MPLDWIDPETRAAVKKYFPTPSIRADQVVFDSSDAPSLSTAELERSLAVYRGLRDRLIGHIAAIEGELAKRAQLQTAE